MRDVLGVLVGYSDHTSGTINAVASVAMGASVFEKHFTLHRWWKGTDQVFSLEPDDMKKLIRDLNNVREAMKEGKFLLESEKKPLYKMGKKLVFSHDMTMGEVITASDVRIVSPNDGLPPTQLDNILNRKLKLDVTGEDTIQWEYIE